ncbi:class I SAM-dependent methyltransferase [Streptomyces chisholmiae]|nr:methyltransferase domain-containing protein [Streptomyces sp. DSM 44915]
MSETEFDTFFEPYAGNVEGFYEATYWRLADDLIKELFRRHLGVRPGQHILDAGGGTGRWAIWAAGEFRSSVTVADRSGHMLRQAEKNLAASPDAPDVRLVECDLHDAPELADAQFDAVISTYGVLSFLEDPDAAFRTLFRVLRPGGQALLMSHSYSNALASKVNRDGADVAELRELAERRIVRWAPHVPPLRVFSAQDLRDHATAAGFEAQAVFGVTSVVSPGPEDFGYPYDAISEVSRRLEDPAYFATVLDLELAASERPESAERGTNLMIKVRRPDATV